MKVTLDPVCRAILDVIRLNDYTVHILREDEAYRLKARHRDGSVCSIEGTDIYRAVCDLAEQLGIKLDDG